MTENTPTDTPTGAPAPAPKIALMEVPEVVAEAATHLGIELVDEPVELTGGVVVRPHGVDRDRTVFVMAHGRGREMVGRAQKLVTEEILKFTLIKADYPQARTLLVFASSEAKDSMKGWLQRAAEVNGVEVVLLPGH